MTLIQAGGARRTASAFCRGVRDQGSSSLSAPLSQSLRSSRRVPLMRASRRCSFSLDGAAPPQDSDLRARACMRHEKDPEDPHACA
jgi:hypothetical protein